MSKSKPLLEENVKQRILLAAKSEFIKHGYDGARMQRIADIAKINKSMLHYYYINKETLFKEIFIEVYQHFHPQLLDIVQSNISFFDKIRNIMYAHIDLLSRNPEFPLFINSELSKGNMKVKELLLTSVHNQAFLELAKQIEHEVTTLRIRKVQPMQLIVNILAMNVFPFISKNLMTLLLPIDPFQYDLMIEQRKTEAAEFIINSITIPKI